MFRFLATQPRRLLNCVCILLLIKLCYTKHNQILNANGPLPFKLVFDIPGGEYLVPVGWGGEGNLKASAIKGREHFRHFVPQI